MRNNINYLMAGNTKVNPDEQFTLEEGNTLEVYFSSPLTILESFFNVEYDELTAYIVSIDLSTVNSSNIISVKKIFKGCNSLKSINFSGFNT